MRFPKDNPPMSFTRDGGTWLYCDQFGNVWRLTPTDDPDMPLVMTIVDRPSKGGNT